MNQNVQQPLILDVKDLFLFFLKKFVSVLIVGAIFAGVFSAYKIVSNYRTGDYNDSAVILDVSEKLPDETDVSYAERLQNVNRAKDIVNSISVINKQIENQRKYVSDCVLMQIDPENEAVTTATLIVEVEGSLTNGADKVLVSSYKQYILSGEYLSSLSKELGINQGYMTELITADDESVTAIPNVSPSNDNIGLVSIRVIGPTLDYTNEVMDTILENVNLKCIDLNNEISHTVKFSSRQSAYVVDTTTRDKQYNATNRFENLQTQISNFDKSLDAIATKLGVSKTNIYAYFSFNDFNTTSSSSSVFSIIKYCIVGFLFGVIIAFVVVSFSYIFGKRFKTKSNFFNRFYWVNNVGIVKPDNNRSGFIKYLDRKSGDDNIYTVENTNKLLAANINNLTKGMNKVLFTGTADIKKTRKLINELGVKGDIKDSFFNDPMCLNSLSEYDGVIIIEQRNYSDCRVVSEELKLISNAQIKLIGAIIL